ncbi:hypothetical protein ABID30_002026 [Enterococcus rotai]|uniref:Uncharacterized protein n=1 Tax=Enterococcus rotai TaxID=118060 RepID=A0A0U2WXL6_9ENTE|nr:hypothetical protein [Enterococcus rotai]ALS36778.1 hypothetical protein ATZ35_06295 [Enterococcus rotai]
MANEQVEKHQKKGLGYIFFIEGIFSVLWIGYLFKFYSFYKEAYFYVDKRLSLFIQMLSILNNNWDEIFIYFILSFFLITLTLFMSYLLYLTNKRALRRNKSTPFILCFNLLCCASLLANVCGFIFFVITILSASLVYIIFTLVNLNLDKEKPESEYDEGDIIEIKGPFKTKEEAQKEITIFFDKWKEKTIILGEEIYIEDGNYYVDIYVDTINK